MPQVNVLIELIHGFLLYLDCADAFGLDAFGAFEDIFDADLVGGESGTSSPVASDTCARISSLFYMLIGNRWEVPLMTK
jgi:hypothetical protein